MTVEVGWAVSRASVLDAFQQAWPPFALVTGLLLIGVTAHRGGEAALRSSSESG